MKGFKVIDHVFYYPSTMPDEHIKTEIIRNLLIGHGVYNEVVTSKKILLVVPTSVKKQFVYDLIRQNSSKTILFIYLGENIYGYYKLIFHIYALLRKLFSSSKIIDKLLLNYPILMCLSVRSPLQTDTYFKRIVQAGAENHFFILTNNIPSKNHVFFAPYFYYVCQDRVRKIAANHKIKEPKRKKFCAFIVSNPNNIDRILFYKKLSKYKEIDSFGKILNTKQLTDSNKNHNIVDAQRNDAIYEDYKFVICFENSYAKGYITEKLINAVAGGAIPIYRGASDLGDYFNLDRVISYDHYGKSYDTMISKIIELDQDENKYEQFIKQPIFKNADITDDLIKHDKKLVAFIKQLAC